MTEFIDTGTGMRTETERERRAREVHEDLFGFDDGQRPHHTPGDTTAHKVEVEVEVGERSHPRPIEHVTPLNEREDLVTVKEHGSTRSFIRLRGGPDSLHHRRS